MKKVLSVMLMSALVVSCAGAVSAAQTDAETEAATEEVTAVAASDDATQVGAGTDVSESGTSGTVYFQKPDAWSGTQVYCHIYLAEGDGTSFYGWQLKAEKCTNDSGSTWSYDLSVLDDSTQLDTGLVKGTNYNIMFSDNVGNEGCPLMFNTNVIGDTYKITDSSAATFENPVDSTKKQWKATWTKNAKKYGIPLTITSVGTIQGEFISKGTKVSEIIDQWDKDYASYPSEQSYSTQSSARDHATRLAEIKDEIAKMVSKGEIYYVGGGTYTESASSSSSSSKSSSNSSSKSSSTGSSGSSSNGSSNSGSSDSSTSSDSSSSNSSTVLKTADGKTVTKTADGKYVDENGNEVQADDVVEVTTDGTVSTGESSTYIFVALGVMLVAAGIYFVTRKKKA